MIYRGCFDYEPYKAAEKSDQLTDHLCSREAKKVNKTKTFSILRTILYSITS